MNIRHLLPLLLVMIVLAACGGSAASSIAPISNQTSGMSGGAPMAEAPVAAEAQRDTAFDSEAAPVSPEKSSSQQSDTDRLVIKNANVSLQVKNVREAEATVRQKVEQLGGYVVQSESYGADEESMSVSISFRVPADRFDAALDGVQGIAEKVLGRSISGDDVTEEFVDLQSRLTNLEATRTRLLDLMDKANRVEDALSVNDSLTQVQGEIEQIRGRMKYLQQSAALSTVSVNLQPVPVTPIVREGEWQPVAVAREALAKLITLGQGIANLLIVIAVWTPLWLPVLLFGWWLRRRLGRRSAGQKPTEA